jgi:hypothetical protein
MFGNDSSSGDTFKSYGKTSDHEACSSSVDVCKVYGMDEDRDNDDLASSKEMGSSLTIFAVEWRGRRTWR